MELREPRGAASARRLILVLASLAGGGCFATVDLSGLSGPPGDVPTPPTALSPTPEAGLDGAVTADSAAGNGKDAGVGDAQPWTAIASSTAPGSDAAWMLDGIGETAWSSNGPQNNNTTVTVDLGEPRTFDSVVVRAPDGLSGDAPAAVG